MRSALGLSTEVCKRWASVQEGIQEGAAEVLAEMSDHGVVGEGLVDVLETARLLSQARAGILGSRN